MQRSFWIVGISTQHCRVPRTGEMNEYDTPLTSSPQTIFIWPFLRGADNASQHIGGSSSSTHLQIRLARIMQAPAGWPAAAALNDSLAPQECRTEAFACINMRGTTVRQRPLCNDIECQYNATGNTEPCPIFR
jgi:hypothetical protein